MYHYIIKLLKTLIIKNVLSEAVKDNTDRREHFPNYSGEGCVVPVCSSRKLIDDMLQRSL